MTFSTASNSDIALIQELAEKTWWPTYGPLQPKAKIEFLLETFYSTSALSKSIKGGDQEFILLHDDGVPQGFASFGEHPSKKSTYKLFKLYVLPSTQGKGYGRALIEEVKSRVIMRSHGLASELELNVYRGNPARRFYEKIGFVVIEEVNEPVGDFFFEDYVMTLTLKGV
jgi:GNAT superfamily N-acetyltransferase